jgi:hypothetical protein
VEEILNRRLISYRRVDVEDDDALDLARSMNVRRVPTYVFLRAGTEVARVEGASLDRLEEALQGCPDVADGTSTPPPVPSPVIVKNDP